MYTFWYEIQKTLDWNFIISMENFTHRIFLKKKSKTSLSLVSNKVSTNPTIRDFHKIYQGTTTTMVARLSTSMM